MFDRLDLPNLRLPSFPLRSSVQRLHRALERDESVAVGFHPVPQWATVAVLAVVYGCSSGALEAPPLAPPNAAEARTAAPGPPLLAGTVPTPVGSTRDGVDRTDALLIGSRLRDAGFQREVERWKTYWHQGAGRRWLPVYLNRMASWSTPVDSALSAHRLPPSLRYLPVIESGYSPLATSWVGAAGLWQLMPVTGRILGLEVTPILDERRDPMKSTGAAMQYLTELNREFGSWFITLAAYNAGPSRVRRLLAAHAPGEPYSDSLFWALRDHFPVETQNYIPKMYATIELLENPEEYGLHVPTASPPRFDVVSVPGLTSLATIARAAGVPLHEITWLNPEFVRGVTPSHPAVELRLPQGRGVALARAGGVSDVGMGSRGLAGTRVGGASPTEGWLGSADGPDGGGAATPSIPVPTVAPLAPSGGNQPR